MMYLLLKFSVDKSKEMIAYFKDGNLSQKSKEKRRKKLNFDPQCWNLLTILRKNAERSSSVNLPVTGIAFIPKLIPTGEAIGSTTGNGVLFELVVQKNDLGNHFWYCLQVNPIDKIEYEHLCNNLTEYVDGN